MNSLPERNLSLDRFRVLLSVLVIAIHAPYALTQIPYLGWIISMDLSRIAVPCFFVISGFYLQPIIRDAAKFKKYLLNLLRIYVVWMILYIPTHGQTDATFTDQLIPYLNMVFWGWSILWYMAALIVATIVLYFIVKLKIPSWLVLGLSTLAFLVGWCLQRKLIPFDLNMNYYRSFVSLGVPFLFAGYYIHDKKLAERFKQTKVIEVAIAILLLCLAAESIVMSKYSHAHDFNLALPLLCPLLILWFLQKGKYGPSDGYLAKLASAIFFSHMLIINVLQIATTYTDTKLFIMATFLSFVVGAGVVAVNKRLRLFL